MTDTTSLREQAKALLDSKVDLAVTAGKAQQTRDRAAQELEDAEREYARAYREAAAHWSEKDLRGLGLIPPTRNTAGRPRTTTTGRRTSRKTEHTVVDITDTTPTTNAHTL